MKKNKARFAAKYAMLVLLAIIFSYIEAKLPSFIAIPGIKLGLTNAVVLVALYLKGDASAYAINFIRIAVISLLFGNFIGFVYSLAGGMLSTTAMVLLKKTKKLGIITVSVIGGIVHNIGQIIVAALILKTVSVGWYLAVLWISGSISGAFIGLLGGELCKRLKKLEW